MVEYDAMVRDLREGRLRAVSAKGEKLRAVTLQRKWVIGSNSCGSTVVCMYAGKQLLFRVTNYSYIEQLLYSKLLEEFSGIFSWYM